VTTRVEPTPEAPQAAAGDRLDRLIVSLERIVGLLDRLVELHEVQHDLPEALDATEAARLCAIGRTRFLELDAEGLCPAPISLGARCPRWSRHELLAWLRSGAVPRVRWSAMRDALMRRAG
jgi:predicted DNA-binding transcriptional regulator AlpA